MLVLSRKLGESVIFDSAIVATVAVIAPEFVELSLTNISGDTLGSVTLGKDHLSHIAHGVRAILIKTDLSKIRLGFEYPIGVVVTRQ